MYEKRQVTVDLSVYRQLGFYQLLDPSGPRLRGRHIYRAVLKVFLLLVQLIVIFGLSSFFVEKEDAYEKSDLFEIIVIFTNCTLSSFKMYAVVTNSNTIWKLFEMTCIDFLQCTQNRKGKCGPNFDLFIVH